MKKQIFISFSIVFFLVLATICIILYGKGYRFGFDNSGRPDFLGTGILAVSSTPNGAEVFIDGHLTTATNNTLNLAPGDYDVKIVQDGYLPWEKKITIQKETVSRADALLFPNAPKLESITASGVNNPVIDPSFTKIAYVATPSSDTSKNGIFVLDMTAHPLLTLQNTATEIAADSFDAFSGAQISWSPDGKNIIANVVGDKKTPTTYLLDASSLNQKPQDITETLTTMTATWDKQKSEKQRAQLNTLKPILQSLVSQNFSILAWSPDETKILYQASTSATLPPIITPPLIGSDSTPESRSIKKGAIYVYDIKEDKNFAILDAQTAAEQTADGENLSLQWFPDSTHLIYTHDKQIQAMDYDGGNRLTIYAGPFVDHYVFPWPDGSRIVILTNFNNNQISPNLYTISLK